MKYCMMLAYVAWLRQHSELWRTTASMRVDAGTPPAMQFARTSHQKWKSRRRAGYTPRRKVKTRKHCLGRGRRW